MGAVCGCIRTFAICTKRNSWPQAWRPKRVKRQPAAPTMGCEVPAISASEQVPSKLESAELSRHNSNKRVEEARRTRVERLEMLRRNSGSEEEFHTARTQSFWTEVDSSSPCSSSSCAPHGLSSSSSEDLQRVHEENRLHFQHIVKTQPAHSLSRVLRLEEISDFDLLPFHVDFEGRLEAGQRIGRGGQADIHEAIYNGKLSDWCVLKVFRSDYCLAHLQHTWTKDITRSCIIWDHVTWRLRNCCVIKHATLLKNGQFAFILQRCWGDLRKAIDTQIVRDKTHQRPPFSLTTTVSIMTSIAIGMMFLHKEGIVHRDLKAANCLLLHDPSYRLPNYNSCLVADYESSEKIVGTKFWRAPEVLLAMKKKDRDINSLQEVQTKMADVYSYAMTCYEVLTGCIPFEERAANEYDGVIGGERPLMPDYVDPQLQELVRSCWHSQPVMRPTFEEIVSRIQDAHPVKSAILI